MDSWVGFLSIERDEQPIKAFLRECVEQVPQLKEGMDERDFQEAVERLRLGLIRRGPAASGEAKLRAIALANVVLDLAKQGWRFRWGDAGIDARRPDVRGAQSDQVKQQQLAQRDEQLRKASVQRFVRSMEKSRLHDGSPKSVFSLMRDGRELATVLERLRQDHNTPIHQVLAPYIEFASAGATCRFTGLKLTDIWRYFRHTWTSPHQSIPGRGMLILIRDAAVRCHPVIGIACLSSAAVQLAPRDEFLGWERQTFLRNLSDRPTLKMARWLLATVETRASEVLAEDLISDGVLPSNWRNGASPGTAGKLREHGRQAKSAHRSSAKGKEYKSTPGGPSQGDSYWATQARLDLFVSKRCEEIAHLIELRASLLQCMGGAASRAGLITALGSGAGRNAISQVLRLAKKACVGTAIADLSVCGAIPPYGAVLGGKLVAMLLATPTVVAEYRRRYGGMPSVIASSMAGRTITRPADLAYIGTMSLFGRPNQYDRLAMPADVLGGSSSDRIRYRLLKRADREEGSGSRGHGTFQFGEATARAVEAFMIPRSEGRRVNYVFGEGTSPRLRALREGLTELHLSASNLLLHRQERVVYGVPLLSNLND